MLGASKSGTSDFRARMNVPANSVLVVGGADTHFWLTGVGRDIRGDASGKLLTTYYQLEHPDVMKKKRHRKQRQGQRQPASGTEHTIWGDQARDLSFFVGLRQWPRPPKATRGGPGAATAEPSLPPPVWIPELLAAIHVRTPRPTLDSLAAVSNAAFVFCALRVWLALQPKDTKYVLLARDPTTRMYSIVRDFYGVAKAAAKDELPEGFQRSAEWFHFFVEEQLRFDCLGLVNKSLEEVPVDPDALLNCVHAKTVPGRGRRPMTTWGHGPAHTFAQLEHQLYIWYVVQWQQLTGSTLEHIKVVRTEDTRQPGTLEGLYVASGCAACGLSSPNLPSRVLLLREQVDVAWWCILI